MGSTPDGEAEAGQRKERVCDEDGEWRREKLRMGVSVDEWRIGGGEVRDIVESLVRRMWKDAEGVDLEERFRVMTYQEAMSRVCFFPLLSLCESCPDVTSV